MEVEQKTTRKLSHVLRTCSRCFFFTCSALSESKTARLNLVRANYSKPTAYKSRPSQFQKTQKKSQSIHESGTKHNTQAFTCLAHMLVVFLVYFSALSESKTARLIASSDASIVKHGQCCRSLINSNKNKKVEWTLGTTRQVLERQLFSSGDVPRKKRPCGRRNSIYIDFSGIFHGLRSSSECPMTVCVEGA